MYINNSYNVTNIYYYKNKLRKVAEATDQFTYDYNGNLTNDYFNNNTDIKYDHRNLITEITRVDELVEPPTTYITTYKYVEDSPWRNEGGNRINKKITKDDGSTMEIIVNEYYIRDVSGKEIAVYEDTDLEFWNVWGNGNKGRITADGIRYYYIKDHLGSIRAVLNENNDLVEAIDYDAWGHIARYWNSTASKYKFTGKERDNETGYDYFGARYYDSRIGRWEQEDPIENNLSFNPYTYALNNPLFYFDPNGKIIDPFAILQSDKDNSTDYFYTLKSNLELITGLRLFLNNLGYLDYEKSDGKPVYEGGSNKARELLIKIMDNSTVVRLFLFGGKRSQSIGNNIGLDPLQIDAFMKGAKESGLNENTMGWGFTLLHEALHTDAGLNLKDPKVYGTIGDIETELNVAREELGDKYGVRFSYSGLEFNGYNWIPFDLTSKINIERGEIPTSYHIKYLSKYNPK